MRALVLAAAILLASCATSTPEVGEVSATAPAVADTPIKSPSGEYGLDPSHTSVVWKVQHMGLALYVGRFDKIAGTLTLDAAAPTKSALSVTIDPKSVSTPVPNAERKARFDGEIAKALGEGEIKFVSTSMVRTGAQSGRMSGDLTFNGVTKPVTMDVTLRGEGVNALSQRAALGVAGKTKIKRSEWNMSFASAFAADEVTIEIDAEFIKK
jgi:polyisoprenoid-binding protein YceI